MQVGVQNLQKIFAAAGTATGAVRKVYADGRVGLTDLGTLFNAAQKLAVLTTVEPTAILAEVVDLEALEAKALVEAFFRGMAEA